MSGKANNETKRDKILNRAGGEPPPHGRKSGVGKIKKQRHFAEKTLGGVTRRQPNFCRKSEKFFSGIVLQRNTNLF